MWSGGFGIAGSTFSMLVLVYFFRKKYLEAIGTFIVAGLPSTIISTIILYMGAEVSITYLGVMFASSVAGAWCGSHMAIKRGDKFIRLAMVAIALLMLGKVILDLA